MTSPIPPGGYVTVADLQIDAVRPRAEGFLLEGRGADSADYQLELHIDMPIDRQTRTVLAEIFSQSEWRVSRRAPKALRPLKQRKPTPSR